MKHVRNTTKVAKNLKLDRLWALGENTIILLKEHNNQMSTINILLHPQLNESLNPHQRSFFFSR